MSQLLQNAVIEASALRDAALRNAESLLVEKYSGKIKSAIDEILEVDDEEDPAGETDPGLGDAGGAEDLGLGDLGTGGDAADAGGLGADMGGGDPGAESSLSEDIPLAATDGKKLCSCPDEEEEIEIDFGDLEAQMAQDTDMTAGDMTDREGLADQMTGLPGEEEEPIMEAADEADESDDVLDESDLAAILEELQVEAEPVSSGYLGTNATERKEAGEISLARLRDEEVQEELEELKSSLSDLTEQKNRATEKTGRLLEQNKSFRALVLRAQELIKETNVINARLMYANRVLRDASLNERQKKEFADVILKADSADKAKVMYETLQRSAGAGSVRKNAAGPQALTEASNRSPSRSNPFVREREKKQQDPDVERMKLLAGVKSQKLQ